jgi:fumarate reductase subunit C
VSARVEAWLWIVQRAGALILTFAVALHLATIIYAVHHGLTAAAILARTQGNLAWLIFYAIFALAAALHGGIGLRTIIRETTVWRGITLDITIAAVIVALSFAGWCVASALFA